MLLGRATLKESGDGAKPAELRKEEHRLGPAQADQRDEEEGNPKHDPDEEIRPGGRPAW
jgi:hypothetical protein